MRHRTRWLVVGFICLCLWMVSSIDWSFPDTFLTTDTTDNAEAGLKRMVNLSTFVSPSIFTLDNLTLEQLEGSLLHVGNVKTLQQRARQLLERDQGDFKTTRFFEFLHGWLSEIFSLSTSIGVKIINHSIIGHNSEYYAHCIQDWPELRNVDLLLVEFAINDHKTALRHFPGFVAHFGRPLEELLRKLRRWSPNTHVVLINLPYMQLLLDPGWPGWPEWVPRCQGPIEINAFLDVARHYKVTSIHWNHIICQQEWPSSKQLRNKVFSDLYRKLAINDAHPKTEIHRQFGSFLIHYLRTRIFLPLQNASYFSPREDRKMPAKLYPTTWIGRSVCFEKEIRNISSVYHAQIALSLTAADCGRLPKVLLHHMACNQRCGNLINADVEYSVAKNNSTQFLHRGSLKTRGITFHNHAIIQTIYDFNMTITKLSPGTRITVNVSVTPADASVPIRKIILSFPECAGTE